MQITESLSSVKPTGVSIFFSAECRMKCKYCYLEDKDVMMEYQHKAVEWIKSNRYISDIQEAFGNDIIEIGFWGAEPSYTLDYVDVEKLINSFSKLEIIHLSTGFLQVEPLLSFVNRLVKSVGDRKFEFRTQITLDGNEEINDINRGKGTTKVILDNIDTLLTHLNSIDTNIEFYVTNNTTIDRENFDYLLSGKVEKQIKFMETLHNKYKDISRKNVHGIFKYYNRIATFCDYDKLDGEKYCKLQDWLFLFKSDIKLRERFNIPVLMSYVMYCNAGVNAFGLDFDRKIHICHRTFGYNLDKYKGKSDVVKNYIFDIEDKEKAFHFGRYISYGSHQFRMSLSTALIKVLVKSGDISPIYSDDFFAYTLAKFINTSVYCPFDNVIQTGSPYITSSNLYRIYGNGLLERYMNYYFGVC